MGAWGSACGSGFCTSSCPACGPGRQRCCSEGCGGGAAASSLPPQTLWPGLKCEGRAGFRRLCVPRACPGSARLPRARSGGQQGPGRPPPVPLIWVQPGPAPSPWAGSCRAAQAAGALLGSAPPQLCCDHTRAALLAPCWAGGAALLPGPPPGLQNACLGPLLAPQGSRCAPTSVPSKTSPCPLWKWGKALIDACARTRWMHVLHCLRK